MKKYGLLLLCLLPLLSGCCRERTGGSIQVAKEIQVQVGTQSYRYTEDAEMRSILTYLRLLDPAVPGDVQTGEGTDTVWVRLSDGRELCYRCNEAGIVFREGKPWGKASPRYAALLGELAKLMETKMFSDSGISPAKPG